MADPLITYYYASVLDGSNNNIAPSLPGTYDVSDTIPDDATLIVDEEVSISGIGATTYIGTWTDANSSQTWPVFRLVDDPNTIYVLTNTQYIFSAGGNYAQDSFITCLLGSTQILCDQGSVQVADLVVGDLIRTPNGLLPVRFIGRSTRNIFGLRSAGQLPVCIEADALGKLGPEQPIHCTPNHAFLVKGCLVEARALVNGTTIRQLQSWDEANITYYSIELEDHALVWANGMLTEIYLATERDGSTTRTSWDNYNDYLGLYGESGSMKELALPRIPFARQLPEEIRQVIGAPAEATPEFSLA